MVGLIDERTKGSHQFTSSGGFADCFFLYITTPTLMILFLFRLFVVVVVLLKKKNKTNKNMYIGTVYSGRSILCMKISLCLDKMYDADISKITNISKTHKDIIV